jgi:hypothetical protein
VAAGVGTSLAVAMLQAKYGDEVGDWLGNKLDGHEVALQKGWAGLKVGADYLVDGATGAWSWGRRALGAGCGDRSAPPAPDPTKSAAYRGRSARWLGAASGAGG